jgi:hypothetical protein
VAFHNKRTAKRNFHEILQWEILLKFVNTFKFLLKSEVILRNLRVNFQPVTQPMKSCEPNQHQECHKGENIAVSSTRPSQSEKKKPGPHEKNMSTAISKDEPK